MDDRAVDRPPLMIGIGGFGIEMVSRIEPADVDILLLDTDIRTLRDKQSAKAILVGKNVVNGEGTGDNLNTAKACFKVSMEEIAQYILSRPLVMTIASANGSTGVAGSVEIVQFLSRIGLSTFSFLIFDPGVPGNTSGKQHMMKMLVTGPLRPASGITVLEGNFDPDKIIDSALNVCRCASEGIDYQVPSSSWNYLREMEGPYEVMFHPSIDDIGKGYFGPPGILFFRMPRNKTMEELRGLISDLVLTTEGIGIGIMIDDDADEISLYSIQKARQSHFSAPDSSMDPGSLKEMIGSELVEFMEPSKSL